MGHHAIAIIIRLVVLGVALSLLLRSAALPLPRSNDANIGAGLIAFGLVVLVSFGWALVDARRRGAAPTMIVWAVVAAAFGLLWLLALALLEADVSMSIAERLRLDAFLAVFTAGLVFRARRPRGGDRRQRASLGRLIRPAAGSPGEAADVFLTEPDSRWQDPRKDPPPGPATRRDPRRIAPRRSPCPAPTPRPLDALPWHASPPSPSSSLPRWRAPSSPRVPPTGDTSGEARGGTLKVKVAALPGARKVVVRGPHRFKRVLTSTTILRDLAPGRLPREGGQGAHREVGARTPRSASLASGSAPVVSTVTSVSYPDGASRRRPSVLQARDITAFSGAHARPTATGDDHAVEASARKERSSPPA